MPFKFLVIAAALIAAIASSFGVHAATSIAPNPARKIEAIPAALPNIQADLMKGRLALAPFTAGVELRVAQGARTAVADTPDTAPEPSRHALLLAGVACIGFIAVRRAASRR